MSFAPIRPTSIYATNQTGTPINNIPIINTQSIYLTSKFLLHNILLNDKKFMVLRH